MKILYLSSSYVPSRRASSIQVMSMCSALSRHGHRVDLVTKRSSRRQIAGVEDSFRFYGLAPSFRIIRIPRPAIRGGGLVYLWGMRRLLQRQGASYDLVFCRDLVGAWLAVRASLPTAFEAHEPVDDGLQRRLWSQVREAPTLIGLVTISQTLAAYFRADHRAPGRGRILVAPDGASEELATTVPPKVETPTADRVTKLQLGYVGNLYPGRGVEILQHLARTLDDCTVHLVGVSTEEAEARLRGDPPRNLVCHGFVPPRELPRYYQSFDIVLMPYQQEVSAATGRTSISKWMSPLKMFEYMAAGKAIISSDLPVLREILVDQQNALLVAPDDADGWVQAVRELQADHQLRSRLGASARSELLERYTWAARARTIVEFLRTSDPMASNNRHQPVAERT
jgi:glycosyltransferase involved in cell wall biosynthesis